MASRPAPVARKPAVSAAWCWLPFDDPAAGPLSTSARQFESWRLVVECSPCASYLTYYSKPPHVCPCCPYLPLRVSGVHRCRQEIGEPGARLEREGVGNWRPRKSLRTLAVPPASSSAFRPLPDGKMATAHYPHALGAAYDVGD